MNSGSVIFHTFVFILPSTAIRQDIWLSARLILCEPDDKPISSGSLLDA